VLHVAFMEAKSNLTRETFNTLTAAATHAMQLNRTVNVRVFALGQRETDAALWQRRLYAVKDELVRLGVPVERIRTEGAGPYMIVIRGQEPVPPRSARDRTRSDLDTVSDPLANE
jgi:outer membrane protein OmpA-like peptidoglycan-associated protein